VCAFTESTPKPETPAMTTQTTENDTEDEYNIEAEPRTRGGKTIVWQAEVYHSGPDNPLIGSTWVDYAPNYNIVLEAALQVLQPIVEITGPADAAGGVWECNVMTCIQTNSETKVERRIRRVVVTTSGS
jgi:hypothetical protein